MLIHLYNVTRFSWNNFPVKGRQPSAFNLGCGSRPIKKDIVAVSFREIVKTPWLPSETKNIPLPDCKYISKKTTTRVPLRKQKTNTKSPISPCCLGFHVLLIKMFHHMHWRATDVNHRTVLRIKKTSMNKDQKSRVPLYHSQAKILRCTSWQCIASPWHLVCVIKSWHLNSLQNVFSLHCHWNHPRNVVSYLNWGLFWGWSKIVIPKDQKTTQYTLTKSPYLLLPETVHDFEPSPKEQAHHISIFQNVCGG